VLEFSINIILTIILAILKILNIRDYDSVKNASKNCNHIIHLAALIGIPYSYISPSAYIKTNIEGTYNILEASRENKSIESIIITSTSEVYGTAQSVPMNELHPIVCQSPYAASKAAADSLAISYQKSFNLPINILRPFNTYGPRQSNRAIIPTIISQLLNDKDYIELGNINISRDFNFVNDTCNAFFQMFRKKKFNGEIYNVSSENEYELSEIISILEDITKIKKKIKFTDIRKRPKSSEVVRLLGDCTKFKKLYKWEPSYSFREGLKETYEYIKESDSHIYKSSQYNV
jgi:nucleoside-diphosphate-sugar epimerase